DNKIAIRNEQRIRRTRADLQSCRRIGTKISEIETNRPAGTTGRNADVRYPRNLAGKSCQCYFKRVAAGEVSQWRHLFSARRAIRDFQHVVVCEADVILAVAEDDLINPEHFANASRAAARQSAMCERQKSIPQRGS